MMLMLAKDRPADGVGRPPVRDREPHSHRGAAAGALPRRPHGQGGGASLQRWPRRIRRHGGDEADRRGTVAADRCQNVVLFRVLPQKVSPLRQAVIGRIGA